MSVKALPELVILVFMSLCRVSNPLQKMSKGNNAKKTCSDRHSDLQPTCTRGCRVRPFKDLQVFPTGWFLIICELPSRNPPCLGRRLASRRLWNQDLSSNPGRLFSMPPSMENQNQTVVITGMSNREFLERYALPGRVGLSGGVTLVDMAIARAERHLDASGKWGSWSHA